MFVFTVSKGYSRGRLRKALAAPKSPLLQRNTIQDELECYAFWDMEADGLKSTGNFLIKFRLN